MWSELRASQTTASVYKSPNSGDGQHGLLSAPIHEKPGLLLGVTDGLCCVSVTHSLHTASLGIGNFFPDSTLVLFFILD